MTSASKLISIVTPSFNQGAYIRATIESVKQQDYPHVEHIVIDGGSTDNTRAVLSEYPHLIVVSEPDRGHADAINKGFRMARGDVFGFLNSDDTLAPGALRRAAVEIDPAAGRDVIMGKCCFIDEQGQPTGINHPSYFLGYRRLLQVWRGHGIPQPSVFWTRQVWEQCGPMDEKLGLPWIDYDFFCRVAKAYPLHAVDQQFSCYRLHLASKTVGSSEEQRMAECIRISRRYWGPAWSFDHLYLALSLARYRFDRVGRARRLLGECQRAGRERRWLWAGLRGSAACLLAPGVCLNYLVFPIISRQAIKWIRKLVLWRLHRQRSPAATAYEDYHQVWQDGWVGPRLETRVPVDPLARALLIRGIADTDCLCEPLRLAVSINGQRTGEARIDANGPFEVLLPMAATPEGRAAVTVETKQWFVMDDVLHNGDMRPLSWKMEGIEFVNEAPPTRPEASTRDIP